MSRAKVGCEDFQMIIGEEKDGIYEVTVYHNPNSDFLTIFIDKEELIRLVGQLEVLLNLA